MVLIAERTSSRSERVRRTTADDIFDEIFEQIISLKLPPGGKVSEVEVARQFDVSRQPVREAFIGLGNMGLLLIRPQRVTTVRKISLRDLTNARFIRLSIELEALHLACKNFDTRAAQLFDQNLETMRSVAASSDYIAFEKLDDEFHRLVCNLAGYPESFKTIEECMIKTRRVCRLSKCRDFEHDGILDDHTMIVEAMKEGNEATLLESVRAHMSRLDQTITQVFKANREYFED